MAGDQRPPVTGTNERPARFQSGVVHDYVTWVVAGLACLGELAFSMVSAGGTG